MTIRRRALLNHLSNPYLNILLFLLLALLILVHWSVRDQLEELRKYNEGRVADTGHTLQIVGKYKAEIANIKEKLAQKCNLGPSETKVIPPPPSNNLKSDSDIMISNVNLKSLLNGPIPCTTPCAEHRLLIEHIKTVMDPPSGTQPVLKDPEGIKNQRGQTGQVELILKYFNNKVDRKKKCFSIPRIFYTRNQNRKI